MSREQPPSQAVPPATAAVGTCPACGGPLYPWARAPAAAGDRDETYLFDRCEDCDAAVMREADFGELDLLAGARRRGDTQLQVAVPNRRSVQAGLGVGRWAALSPPERQLALTPLAVSLVLERQGRSLVRLYQPPLGRNQLWMWQTLMNALTFHPNFAREALAGRLRPRVARGRVRFAIDALVSVLAAPLVALVAVPAELLAVALRRGGLVVAIVRPPGRAARPARSAPAAPRAPL